MAKRNGEDAKEGFQIPIEDAAGEQAADEATPEAGETPAADEATETDEAPAADEAPEAPDAPETPATPDAPEAGDELPALDDEEIIAEAEAVVEEAAEGLSAEEQLESAKAKAQEWQDRYMRLHAEWDTYRRRTQDQRAEEKVRATEKLMENLLPVLDDFERTVSYATENGETGLLDGVKAVQSKLVDALTKGGLQVIDPVGEPYDALEAQAVQVVPDEEAYVETVKDVFQKGYKMGKKVLRAAMVTVTSGGPKRPKDEKSEEG